MNKEQIVNQIAQAGGLTQSNVEKALEGLEKVVVENLRNGIPVKLWGFGEFRLHISKERSGRNPRTGEIVQVPAKKRAKFYSSAALDRAVGE